MTTKEPLRKRKTVLLKDELGEYLSTLKVANEGNTRKVFAQSKVEKSMNLLVCWQRIASERVVQHTDNVVYSTRSKNTEILVYVDSATYAAELTMDKEAYRLSMQRELGKEIEDIKFFASRKSAFKKRSNK